MHDVLRMPVTLRGELSEQTIFHNDTGTQGASERTVTLAKDKGLACSMCYVDVCRDNAMAESFVATLKNEFYCRRVWPAKKRARTDVGKWIDAATTVEVVTLHSSRHHRSLLKLRYVTNAAARRKAA